MSSAKVIILEYICPGLGALMANIMFFSPVQDLRKAIQSGDLGVLNPTPWVFMLGNCFGWVAYSILLQNLWIFFANCPGFLLSIWLNLWAVKLLYQMHYTIETRQSLVNLLMDQELTLSKNYTSLPYIDIDIDNGDSDSDINDQRVDAKANMHVELEGEKDETNDIIERSSPIQQSNSTRYAQSRWTKIIMDVTSQRTPAPTPHENLVMIISIIWVVCISTILLIPSMTQKNRELVVASLVNFNLVFFYGAPLSTIYTVVREKDSSSIHILTMINCTLNGLFWTGYGIAVFDLFVAVPNGIGAFLGFIQMMLLTIFPRRNKHSEEDVLPVIQEQEGSGIIQIEEGNRDSDTISFPVELERE
mmetsp:Transcript_1937/g.2357  ORF Transcript_1937/g.2357 Transcript_1937/m.2357 type:complete len:361 (+) Transcript_1937:247-1329(+)